MTADHDDGLADAMALVEAALRNDALAAGAILRNMDREAVVVVLAKLLSELVADNIKGFGVCHVDCWREWVQEAIARS